jgi:putative protease
MPAGSTAPRSASRPAPELLAPAGEPDSAFAAFQYGADAVYLGLRRFSARAEAVNFGLDELSEVVAFAHAATPRRRVYVAINTLLRNDELPALAHDLAAVADLGVDALIVQDLGVARLTLRHCPGVALHASTQLAVHNRAGARALRGLGFRRVTLARELALPEVRAIVEDGGLEVEVFLHGALCYSYSGLCLYSSLLRGRSGNRGQCAYPCRDVFAVEGDADARSGEGRFLFSMKDLALADHVAGLRRAGVCSLKLEGRKKSPLYVAAVTAFYRGLLDGTLSAAERRQREADLQTVFSRPWTSLYVDPDRGGDVVDPRWVGHRGARIGEVEAVVEPGTKRARLRFRTARRVEKHDGLQVDLPAGGRPFGFAVDRLRLVEAGGRRREVFEAAAGATVEVDLPPDAPRIPAGAPLYCAASQEVRARYRFTRPRPGVFRVRRPLEVRVTIGAEGVIARGAVRGRADESVTASLPGPLDACRDAAAMADAVRRVFAKLGDTAFELGNLTVVNADGRFVPVSALNGLRRELVARLEQAAAVQFEQRVAVVTRDTAAQGSPAPADEPVRWSVKVAGADAVEAFTDEDWAGVGEVVLALPERAGAAFAADLARLAARAGRERVRLGLPLIARAARGSDLEDRVRELRAAGWRRWEAANLSAWGWLFGGDLAKAREAGVELGSDWSVYVTNRVAARQVLEMGAARFCLSPEDGGANLRELVAEFGPRILVPVFLDVPLFISETCPWRATDRCSTCAPRGCRSAERILVSGRGERVVVGRREGRSVTVADRPLNWARHVPDLVAAGARWLRADFSWRPRDASEVAAAWRRLRRGGDAAAWDGRYREGLA